MIWFLIAALIGVNAFYVLAEFAVVSVRQTRLRTLAHEGHALASRLLPIVADPRRLDQYIAACQIGITLSSLVLGAYGQVALAATAGPALEAWGLGPIAAQTTAAVVVLIMLTGLQVVLGELVPKSLALQFPLRAALYTYWPMHVSIVVLSGLIRLLNGTGLALLRMLGIPEAGHRHVHSPEEIDLLIAESADGGGLALEDRERLRRALRLGLRTARALMVPRFRVVAIDADASIAAALRTVADSPYTRLPIYRGTLDNVIGIVHTRNIVARCAEHGRPASLTEDMQPLLLVPESLRAERLLTQMRQHGTQMALVVDEFGGVAGLVTVRDVLTGLLGDVFHDERTAQPRPERLPDGRVRIPGPWPLHEMEPWLGVQWRGEAVTVGGRVVEALGRLPFRGERTIIDGVHVEVEDVRGQTIVSVLARPVDRREART